MSLRRINRKNRIKPAVSEINLGDQEGGKLMDFPESAIDRMRRRVIYRSKKTKGAGWSHLNQDTQETDNPSNAELTLLSLERQAISSGDYEKAVQISIKLVKRDPGRHAHRTRLANSYLLNGELEKASTQIDHVLRRRKDLRQKYPFLVQNGLCVASAIFVAKAEHEKDQGNKEDYLCQALRYANEALDISSLNPTAKFSRGNAYLSMGKLREAKIDFMSAINTSETPDGVKRVDRKWRLDSTLGLAKVAVREGDMIELEVRMSEASIQEGGSQVYEIMERDMSDLEGRADGLSVDSFVMMGLIRKRNGGPFHDMRKSENCFIQALLINPKRLDARIPLIEQYTDEGKFNEARAHIEEARAHIEEEKDHAKTKDEKAHIKRLAAAIRKKESYDLTSELSPEVLFLKPKGKVSP
ncbi:MAG: tetratricopeptide repeat protein [Candidatus Altiarchaeota archaeon]